MLAGRREMGRLTSLVYSTRLEHNIALAMVPIERSAPGQRLSVDTWDGERGVMVAETPFSAGRTVGRGQIRRIIGCTWRLARASARQVASANSSP